MIARLDPLILELERQQDPVLVVSHNAVIRVLMGYLSDEERSQVPHLDVPLHTVMSLTPRAYGCEVKRHDLSRS